MTTSWKVQPLVGLTTLFADGDWIESKDQSPGGIRLIQTGNIGEGLFKDRGEKSRYISAETFKRLRCTEILPGDCLVSRLPEPVGRACILPDVGEPMITAVDCTIIRFDPKQILPEFFTYFSQSEQYITALDRECTGTTRKRIGRSKLGETLVPVPDLAEQERIVTILDEAFANIAIAKANTEAILTNATDLHASATNEALFGSDKDYPLLPLREVADSISTGPFGTMLHKSDYVTNGIPLVNPMNIVDSRIVPSDRMQVSEETRERLKTYVLRRGDVVIGRRGELGRCAVVTEREEGWLCGTGSFFVRLGSSMLPELFVAVFSSETVKATLNQAAVGTTMSSLNHGILAELKLPAPPQAEQQNLIRRLRHIGDEVEQVRRLATEKLGSLEELKKSLLDKAFSGQL